jgi:hypothetical protein
MKFQFIDDVPKKAHLYNNFFLEFAVMFNLFNTNQPTEIK